MAERALSDVMEPANGQRSRSQPPVDFHALVEAQPAVSYVADGDLVEWTYVSPQIGSLLGFAPQEWTEDPQLWFRQLNQEDRARVLEERASSRLAREPFLSEYRMFTRDGRTVWVFDQAILDGEGRDARWLGFLFDISKRRNAEQALQESERRYRSLVDHVPIGLYRSTPQGNLLDGNRTLAQILGFPSREALLAHAAHDFYVDPQDRERWKGLMETEGVVKDFELQLRRADGSVIWVRDSGRVITDRNGEVLWYEGAIEDVTRRKQAEWEARQAHQQLSGWVGELERRNREMSLINEMGDMLQSCPTAEEAYTVMAHWAEQLFSGRAGALYVMASSRNVVEPVAVWGAPSLGDQVFAPEDCWALRSGQPHSAEPGSRLVCRHLGEPVTGPVLCVPMMAAGEALGVLHLQSMGGAAAPVGVDGGGEAANQLAVAVAEHLSLALANLRLRESLRMQSIRDPLTGLFNRRYMEESLERELRRAARRGHPVGVIMLDLDHFNQFNNTFGHQAGDALLQEFAQLVRVSIRAEDIACRYGGEEFTLIMPEASLDIVQKRAEQLVERVQALRVQQNGQSLGTVSVSAGVAVYPEHGATVEAVLRAADKALYVAKDAGRCCVTVASPEQQ